MKVIGKFFEEFIDNAPEIEYNFDAAENKEGKIKNNPEAVIPPIENDSDWVLALYKHILCTDENKNGEGYKNWMKQLKRKFQSFYIVLRKQFPLQKF